MAKPQTVTMVEFRLRAAEILGAVRRGRRMVLTYRGRPVIRLEPISDEAPAQEDPFYRLADLAAPKGTSLTNQQIDETVYGS